MVRFGDDNPVGERLKQLQGVGPDTPIETNELGGQQSSVPYRFDLFDPASMFALAEVLDYGAKRYTPENWRLIDVNSNLNHVMVHIMAYLAGDTQDKHLEHAFCRMMFALGVELQGGPGIGEKAKRAAIEMEQKAYERGG